MLNPIDQSSVNPKCMGRPEQTSAIAKISNVKMIADGENKVNNTANCFLKQIEPKLGQSSTVRSLNKIKLLLSNY